MGGKRHHFHYGGKLSLSTSARYRIEFTEANGFHANVLHHALLFLPSAVLPLEVGPVWPEPTCSEAALIVPLSFVSMGTWEEGGE